MAPYEIKLNNSSTIFYGRFNEIFIESELFYKIDSSAAVHQNLDGYSIDADSKIRTNRLYYSAGADWVIRTRIYDGDGPKDLSSETVTLNFYENSFSTVVFKTYATVAKDAKGNAIFNVPAVDTLEFSYIRYGYTIIVGTAIVIKDELVVI